MSGLGNGFVCDAVQDWNRCPACFQPVQVKLDGESVPLLLYTRWPAPFDAAT